ncbi:MAG: nitroreductase family protein [Alphaproteobacteria bacterium]|nr:nitroreductase family protein [Alphaproteobacteria bacterium]MBU1526702.1 nitroreductase family protein [Alphaproteobacteria bacterium]MBU2116519.1 nitroreductase family protein [Alphaproteobacteria bacterium]MBU2352136.1 nitroreductase family protein [Alphaproteobacteria bacterium]MBU2381839.1 nitroreductase family protein [Alphaproteobacteria bacterium]
MRDHPSRILEGYPELSDAERIARAEAFLALMAKRRTVRDFAPDPVPRAVVEAALLAAGSAPSGANHQPWTFAVIEGAEARRRIREAAEAEERAFYAEKAPQEWLDALAPLGTDPDKGFLEVAPVLIAVFAQKRGGPKPGDARKNYYVAESVGIATGFLIAALHSAGLATLTHTPAPMGFLNEICGRPADEKPFLLLVAGKPAPGATVPEAALDKKPLDRIAVWID